MNSPDDSQTNGNGSALMARCNPRMDYPSGLTAIPSLWSRGMLKVLTGMDLEPASTLEQMAGLGIRMLDDVITTIGWMPICPDMSLRIARMPATIVFEDRLTRDRIRILVHCKAVQVLSNISLKDLGQTIVKPLEDLVNRASLSDNSRVDCNLAFLLVIPMVKDDSGAGLENQHLIQHFAQALDSSMSARMRDQPEEVFATVLHPPRPESLAMVEHIRQCMVLYGKRMICPECEDKT